MPEDFLFLVIIVSLVVWMTLLIEGLINNYPFKLVMAGLISVVLNLLLSKRKTSKRL